MMETPFDNILDDTEKFALENFAGNDRLMEAVKKVLLFAVYTNGTLKPGEKADETRNFAFGIFSAYHGKTNEELGEKFRGVCEGIQAVYEAFEQLKKFKKQEPKVEEKDKTNSAR